MKEITKLEKKLEESFISEIRGCSKSELEFKLLQLAKHREDITSCKNEDEELERAIELVKELKAPYTEQMKANNLKSRFIALIMKDKEE